MTSEDKLPSVLVVGLNRSGTKWLSNLIAGHRDIYAVQHPDHFGIIESNIFNDFARIFPNLASIESRFAFASLWSQTDFVKISGVDLYEVIKSNQPANVFDAFEILMNSAAVQRNASCWLQKCSPVQLAAVGKHFVSSKRVFIKRNFNDVLVSAIENSKSSRAKSSEMRLVLNYCLQNQVLQNFSRQPNTLSISYEELKTKTDQTISKVFEFIGVEPLLQQDLEYTPNTSFANRSERPKLKLSTWLVSRMLGLFLAVLPRGVPFWIWKRLRGNAPPSIVRGTFRVSHENPETEMNVR